MPFFSLFMVSMTVSKNYGFEEKNGFTGQQWTLLIFSFLLGIAAVFTIDRLFLADSAPIGTVQAAVSHP